MPHNENALFEELRLASQPSTKRELEAKLYEAVLRHGKAVCWLILQEPNDELARDIVSRVFLKLPEFKERSLFSTWVHRIAINECFMLLRRRRQSRIMTELTDWAETPSNVANQHLSKMTLEELSEGLRAEDRKLLELKLQGESSKDIGKVLNLTGEGVRTRWHRLRKELKEKQK